MIAWFASLLIRKGLSEERANGIAKATVIGLACLGAILLFTLWLQGQRSDAVKDYQTKIEKKAAPAKEEAAEQRAEDVIAVAKDKEETHRVIEEAPKVTAPVHPATLAHNCKRLRDLGRIPPACRSAGSN